jgi:hypothetical protein
MASTAVLAARQRRAGAAARRDVRIEWFIDKVAKRVDLTMRQRVLIATALVKDQVIRNISRRVTKKKGPRSGRIVVSDRSKPGEFPKADTTRLMKDIFSVVRQTQKGVFDGFVGTSLDYGLILETSERLNRSFLVRTLNEQRTRIKRVLAGPMRT